AAITAAERGARVALLEAHGCLGGIWTSGLLTFLIDHENKGGYMKRLLADLKALDGTWPDLRKEGGGHPGPDRTFDMERMKRVLEGQCQSAGVRVQLFTRGVAVVKEGSRLTHLITESKSGREAWAGKVFLDATGDGDLGALSGCAFDSGRPTDGGLQPMSLLALVSGLEESAMRPFVGRAGDDWAAPKAALREEMKRGGADPSYHFPTLFPMRAGLYQLMANHQYGVKGTSAGDLTRATFEARAELHRLIDGLRGLGGVWKGIRLVASAEQIGVREGRRIRGRATVTAADLQSGARREDGICDATFCVDIHSVDPKEGKGLGDGGIRTKPYQIPYGALVARDVEGLLLAGRCISGDFFAHASYRVTGNAVAMGEAAGVAAQYCAQRSVPPSALDGRDVVAALGKSAP
ncbi:MAG: FAD-dependent oxidoreductase, partial [Spirochaetes bacterium]|nr:FAD-dependent oxidoreductase [Spirochaetota bacterium]